MNEAEIRNEVSWAVIPLEAAAIHLLLHVGDGFAVFLVVLLCLDMLVTSAIRALRWYERQLRRAGDES